MRAHITSSLALGCTGELAEAAAADKLGLKLADARTAGHDALRGGEEIQIKGRAYKKGRASLGRTGIIKIDSDFDSNATGEAAS